MRITVHAKPEAERKPLPADENQLGFGKTFTDHMFLMDYSAGEWKNPRIEPYGSLTLDPAALVLHYGQEIFEGMKAYRQENSQEVSFFRPEKNAQRMNRSAERMSMPTLEPTDFLEALHAIVRIDQRWAPSSLGTALYIRPTMIATEAALGLRTSQEYLFYIILCSVGPYFPEGFKPIKIYVELEYVRAVEGGIGEAKTGGNYAASLLATRKGHSLGCGQVLWLDAVHHKFVEEAGTMNQFFVIDGVIYTAPLSGTILHGITRESVIQLSRDQGYSLKEEQISIDTIIEGIQSGNLTEAFGVGTAAAIAPVGEIYYRD
ncbi:MAG: branched-chain amino acid aminotransferase, partial [Promethearchaeota archaeon]